ncbi:MAG: flavin-dependent dehydrogenase, partial [Phycisphaerales bacterium]|nr:flavin-dependent dehydrogenase [Phycisphaerales bacterium]
STRRSDDLPGGPVPAGAPTIHQMRNAARPAPPSAFVIGAGPAGSLLAVLLARAGWRVAMAEQHRFPRDKVCGECLSALGVEVLRRAGLAGRVRGHGAIPLYHTHLHAAGGGSASIPLPRPMWGVSRHVLDQLLLIEARAAGVDVRQPARCEEVRPAGGVGEEGLGSDARPAVRVRDLLTNAVTEERPDVVVVADGKSALLAGRSPPPPTGDLGLKVHLTGVDGPGDAIELFGTTGTYGGLAPIEAGRWNAAFSVPADLVRLHAGDLEMVFERLVGGNVVLRRRLRNADRASPILASPLPRFGVRRDWPAGVIAVGNAAAALEPIGGEGMGLALRSAELAAEHLTRAAATGTAFDPVRLQDAFAALWRTRRAACRAAARAVSSGRLGGLAMELLRHDDRAGRVALRLMGKAGAGIGG